jgi:hypothetical protein
MIAIRKQLIFVCVGVTAYVLIRYIGPSNKYIFRVGVGDILFTV